MMSPAMPKWFGSPTGNIYIHKLPKDFITEKESRKRYLQDL